MTEPPSAPITPDAVNSQRSAIALDQIDLHQRLWQATGLLAFTLGPALELALDNFPTGVGLLSGGGLALTFRAMHIHYTRKLLR